MRIEAKRTDNNATVIGFAITSSDPGNDWANGIVQANISGAMTQGIVTNETIILRYDVEVTRDTGAVVTILTEWYGTIKLTPDVTVGNPVITPPTEAAIRADLGSTSDSLGAALVGVKASLWASLATNVQEALQWLFQNRLNGPSPWLANRILKTGASSPDTLASGITIDVDDNVTNAKTLTILDAPTIASHATRKDYVDASTVAYLNSLVPLAGEVLTYDGAAYDFQDQAVGVQTVNGEGGANPVLETIDIDENTNLYYTDERVDDRVAALLVEGANITLTYDDPAGTLTIAAGVGGLDERIVFVDSKGSGVDGGTATSGAWRTRDITNLRVNRITGASLASNRITLPIGTYRWESRHPAFLVNAHQSKLRDITAGADIAFSFGTSEYSGSTDNVTTKSDILVEFVVAVITEIEVQHRVGSTYATSGFGAGNSFGNENIFSQGTIIKIA